MILTAHYYVSPGDPKVTDIVDALVTRYGGEIDAEGYLDDACTVYSFDASLPPRSIGIIRDLGKVPVKWVSINFNP